MNKRKKIIIIGGGASGMVAAITAARNGAEVIILEQLTRVGKKLLATGNGRCNLTNAKLGIKNFHGNNPEFAFSAFAQFDQSDTIEFFKDLGIHCIKEDGGKIFPASLQAGSVLDVLRYEMSSLGIEEVCDSVVVSIAPKNNRFEVHLKNGKVLGCDKVILATGGKASPGLGSNGSGYNLAKGLGHSIVEPFPALVKLNLDAPYLKSISGTKIVGDAAIESDGIIINRETGELLFTDYGISGPPILQLSRCAGEELRNGKKTILVLDLFPNKVMDEILNILQDRISLRKDKPLDFSFVGLINKRLINAILKEAGITDLQMPCKDVTDEQLHRILSKLRFWSIPISGTQSWNEAQVTAGGIDVTEINPQTMESKLIPGLYFAGEIMDIDGDCGGFNLQWAWSSGYISGINASR